MKFAILIAVALLGNITADESGEETTTSSSENQETTTSLTDDEPNWFTRDEVKPITGCTAIDLNHLSAAVKKGIAMRGVAVTVQQTFDEYRKTILKQVSVHFNSTQYGIELDNILSVKRCRITNRQIAGYSIQFMVKVSPCKVTKLHCKKYNIDNYWLRYKCSGVFSGLGAYFNVKECKYNILSG